jgi:hypothetical protein
LLLLLDGVAAFTATALALQSVAPTGGRVVRPTPARARSPEARAGPESLLGPPDPGPAALRGPLGHPGLAAAVRP